MYFVTATSYTENSFCLLVHFYIIFMKVYVKAYNKGFLKVLRTKKGELFVIHPHYSTLTVLNQAKKLED